ncbi:MAG: phosphopyruvate hydratase [Christensenellaceae bacterium]|nr:phosphopyruvate hydratase [Christensenellaceae bacterium]
MRINNITAYEAMDSRGTPTVAVLLATDKGRFRAIAPSGASVGSHEAHELRDGGKRLKGKGTQKAVKNINTVIRDRMNGREFQSLAESDELLQSLDHSENKSIIGANAMLAVSMACARAFAADRGEELFQVFGNEPILPCPMLNILNGGAHAANNLDIQEFMILPVGARDFTEAMDMSREVCLCLKNLLHSENFSTGVGDEGGFAPDLRNDEQALEFIMAAVTKAGFSDGQISLALDIAASEWYHEGSYRQPKSGRRFSQQELIAYYSSLLRDYPIVSIEDGMAEDDFDGFRSMMQKLPVQIVGDDLFVTNPERIRKASDCASALLVKPNQIGTVTETLDAIHTAKSLGLACILSHRSGDTEDDFIADLAVGTACGLIKTGAPCRAERTAKYNRLAELEHLFYGKTRFLGKNALKMAFFA